MSVKFGWTDENTVIVIEAYQADLVPQDGETEADAILRANATDNLTRIGELVDNPSPHSVRTKLVNAKVYVKPTSPRKVGAGSSIRKAHVVFAIAKTIEELGQVEDMGEVKSATNNPLLSLESAKMDSLMIIAQGFGLDEDAIKAFNNLE